MQSLSARAPREALLPRNSRPPASAWSCWSAAKWYTPPIAAKTIFAISARPLLGNAFGPEDRRQSARLGGCRRRTAHTALPSEGAYQNNAACVGGGTLSYGAQAWRYMPQDFKMRSTYGAPAGSSLEDWPITYDDLEPFYDKAEYEIGVSGDYSGTPFHGPRRARTAHAAAAAESRVRNSGACGETSWPASVPPADAAQQRALQRPRPVHALPMVLRIRLRSGRKERLAEHRDSYCAEHRQLRIAYRVHGEGDPHRRSWPRNGQLRYFDASGPSAAAARGHRHCVRLRH